VSLGDKVVSVSHVGEGRNEQRGSAPKAAVAAAAGVVAVALLLLTPVHIGEHGDESCGSALVMNLDRWQNNSDGNYRDRAQRACTGERMIRIGAAIPVTLVTVGLVAYLVPRRSRVR
jgi:hypothetical protein